MKLSDPLQLTVATLTDLTTHPQYDDDVDAFIVDVDYGLTWKTIIANRESIQVNSSLVLTPVLEIRNGLDRFTPSDISTIFTKNPRLKAIRARLICPRFLSPDVKNGFADKSTYLCHTQVCEPYTHCTFKFLDTPPRLLNYENAFLWLSLEGNSTQHIRERRLDINTLEFTFYRNIQLERKDLINPTQLPPPPSFDLIQLLQGRRPDRSVPHFKNNEENRNIAAAVAAQLCLSDLNLRQLLNFRFAIEHDDGLPTLHHLLQNALHLHISLGHGHDHDTRPIDIQLVKMDHVYYCVPVAPGGNIVEVPRRQRLREAILRAAKPYCDLSEEEIANMVKIRNWPPEMCYKLKRNLCSENVSCFNIEFGQEYDDLELLTTRPNYKREAPPVAVTSLPTEHPVYIDTLILEPDQPGELKETLHPRYGWTEQFKHERPFQGIFPTHQMKDYSTRKWSLEHRVRYSTIEKNQKRANEGTRRALGSTLFLNFCKYLDLPSSEFNEQEFFSCVTENTRNRLKKPLTSLFNIRERGDLGNEHFTMELFLKSQICKKLEKMYAKAKPGQIISNLHVVIIILMGPVIRYIHRQIEDNLTRTGQKLYLHGGRDIHELNGFVIDNIDRSKTSTTNDFTLFDQSQDVEFLNFQILLMKHLNIPSFFIDYYYHYKTHLQSQYGPVAVMIFSGEPPTWHFNSYDNLAWSATFYLLPRDVPALISGDDSLFNAVLQERLDTKPLKKLTTLQAKIEHTNEPVFCGWICTGGLGVVKHPQLIYIRTRIAFERGNVADVLQSYAEEAQFAYQLGDRLYEVLDPFNLGVQQVLNRFFILNAHKLSKKNLYAKDFHKLLIR